jgi:hypothetical protein
MSAVDAVARLVEGARCWGIELEPRYRVLAVTIEPDPLRSAGVVGEHQLLCFPVSTLLVTVTRPVDTDEGPRTAVVTFGLEELTAVSERFAGATVGSTPFGQPEPRPGTWGPQHSLEGRTSAADGTRRTLLLELDEPDGARLRLFARFDDVELRDTARRVVVGTTEVPLDLTALGTGDGGVGSGGLPGASGEAASGAEPDPDPLRF